ncbi:hypothetical protein [Roseobacter litoralis]|uniref:hypothetical protein n=1 Tax=Roseobacter litoralis TaxID=42443 RepID=UPI002493CA42|nr:hypothetical protein [Roseobacter litoralis]
MAEPILLSALGWLVSDPGRAVVAATFPPLSAVTSQIVSWGSARIAAHKAEKLENGFGLLDGESEKSVRDIRNTLSMLAAFDGFITQIKEKGSSKKSAGIGTCFGLCFFALPHFFSPIGAALNNDSTWSLSVTLVVLSLGLWLSVWLGFRGAAADAEDSVLDSAVADFSQIAKLGLFTQATEDKTDLERDFVLYKDSEALVKRAIVANLIVILETDVLEKRLGQPLSKEITENLKENRSLAIAGLKRTRQELAKQRQTERAEKSLIKRTARWIGQSLRSAGLPGGRPLVRSRDAKKTAGAKVQISPQQGYSKLDGTSAPSPMVS